MIHSLNPTTGLPLRSFDTLSPEGVESKLALAAAAARSYQKEPMEARRFWMRRLALLLDSDREELAVTMVTEMGKPISQARAEVDKCAAVCRFYAEKAERMLQPERIPTDFDQSEVRWDPLGVILAVMPWNFPLWQVFRFLAPALMAGNVALLKHAPNVPECALAIETLVRRAGFPRGAFQALLLENDGVGQVVEDPRVAAVTLTGSEGAGRAVGAKAGANIKKTVLELGGSDPFIVMPSANLPAAVDAGVKARCINSGQSCIAAKRFIVHENVYEDFLLGFVAGMQALRIGDPTNEETEIGPLAKQETLDRLSLQVEAAVAAGGRLLTGGRRIPGKGFFFEPTVIADVPPEAAVCSEETFGPLALVFRVGSLEEAIRLANATPYGLGASCWTAHAAERERLTAELEAGSVFFNAPVASYPSLPFGGIKSSGYGRELSAAGLREFMNAKTVAISLAKPLPPASQNTERPAAAEADSVAHRALTEAEEPRHEGSVLGLTRR